jgi:hypothetical protein
MNRAPHALIPNKKANVQKLRSAINKSFFANNGNT